MSRNLQLGEKSLLADRECLQINEEHNLLRQKEGKLSFAVIVLVFLSEMWYCTLLAD